MFFEDLSVGMRAETTKTIGENEVVGFADISDDKNPIHLSYEYASTTKFGRCIAHGLISAGLISGVLGMKLPGSGAIWVYQTLAFKAPVYVGDTVTASVEIKKLEPLRHRAYLKCECRVDGLTVLDGEAVVSVPRRPKES